MDAVIPLRTDFSFSADLVSDFDDLGGLVSAGMLLNHGAVYHLRLNGKLAGNESSY
jgi:hypothetical protein